jgi:hypothetical protein
LIGRVGPERARDEIEIIADRISRHGYSLIGDIAIRVLVLWRSEWRAPADPV